MCLHKSFSAANQRRGRDDGWVERNAPKTQIMDARRSSNTNNNNDDDDNNNNNKNNNNNPEGLHVPRVQIIIIIITIYNWSRNTAMPLQRSLTVN